MVLNRQLEEMGNTTLNMMDEIIANADDHFDENLVAYNREIRDKHQKRLDAINKADDDASDLRRRLFNGDIKFDVSNINRNSFKNISQYDKNINRNHVDEREVEWLYRDAILKAYKYSLKKND